MSLTDRQIHLQSLTSAASLINLNGGKKQNMN